MKSVKSPVRHAHACLSVGQRWQSSQNVGGPMYSSDAIIHKHQLKSLLPTDFR